ncbi:hypothetical protein Avbf_06314 [Armadillidium vulgare]|nr:hypothetical protein Avbf_06314 [Armadillidium vulgare]
MVIYKDSNENTSQDVKLDCLGDSYEDNCSPSEKLNSIYNKDDSLSDSFSETEHEVDSCGVNLRLFGQKEREGKESGTSDTELESSKSEEKIIFKIKNLSSLEKGNESSGTKLKKKKKKKKKHKHEKHLKKKELTFDSNVSTVCDVDKLKGLETTDFDPTVTSDIPVQSDFQSFFSDIDLCSNISVHPNDTWQTLINTCNASSLENVDNVEKLESVAVPEQDATIEVSEEINSNVTKQEISKNKKSTQKVVKKPKKIQKLAGFTTEQFGNGWSRKIKWNEKGQGKVSFLTSPEGQRIVSSIELMAYFKKAGKTMLELDHYFPKDLVRTLPKEKEECIINNSMDSDVMQRLSPSFTNDSASENKKRKIIHKQPKLLSNKKILKYRARGRIQRAKLLKSNNKDLEKSAKGQINIISDAGPRVKHVCRSQAQVLGMPRAVFPSPEFEQVSQKKLSDNESCKRKGLLLKKKNSQISIASTPKTERVLKKTVWCNKCPGCTTPNCRECVHCLDMKKYGGPGTKKKPCLKRKCFNPLRSAKSLSNMREENTTNEVAEETSVGGRDDKRSDESQTIDYSTPINSEVELMSDPPTDYIFNEEKTKVEELLRSTEKPIFIPKLVKTSIEPKDKGDIKTGKECVPGSSVNIDYWQQYDAEEMLTSGFPIVTSVPLQIESFCFRCGSAGLEPLYIVYGIHPFCLEEGEGPENEEEEWFWVCRKCAVCHVCGAGHYDLLQCSGCKKHYHLECLGPSSHISCQPSEDGIWASDPVHLLPFSWPMQTPIIDVSDECMVESSEETVTLLEELENLHSLNQILDESEFLLKEEICLLPFAMPNTKENLGESYACSPDKKKNIVVESVCIEDTFTDLAQGDHICLEDEFDGVDCLPPTVSLPNCKEEETVKFYRDVDLFNKISCSKENFTHMADDEYLCLKYKKILPFHQSLVETSLEKLLRMLNNEVFDVLGYPKKKFKEKENLSRERSKSKSPVPKVELSGKSGLDIDLRTAIAIRRSEIQQVIKDLEEIRILEEKRLKEIERENRKRRLETFKELNDKEGVKNGRKRLKLGNNQQMTNSGGEGLVEESFLEYKGNPSHNHWQPQTWEEFDELLFKLPKSPLSCRSKKLLKIDNKNKIKRKRGRPRLLSPGFKKARKLKLSQCSVKITRLELRKWKAKRKKLSPRKLSEKRLSKSPRDENKSAENGDGLEGETVEAETSSANLDDVVVPNSSGVDINSKIVQNSECINENYEIKTTESGDRPLIDTVVCEISTASSGIDSSSLLEQENSVVIIHEEVNDSYLDCLNNSSKEALIEINEFEDHQSGNIVENDKEPTKIEKVHKRVSFQSNSILCEKDELITSKRPRRHTFGRASELASLRKAMMDF